MTNYAELDRKRELIVALKRAASMALRDCFDPFKPESRPTAKQKEALEEIDQYLLQVVLGGNQSGKSALGGRVVSWFFTRSHPYIDVNKLWPDEPILIIVVGRLSAQVEELFEKKIKPFLTPGEYRENRAGGSLQYIESTKHRSKIIFQSHANPIEARERLQSFTANLVWMDEMTDHLGVIEELQRRVQAKRGRMLITATPKIRAAAVQKFLEAPNSLHKIYKISMLDNPVYDDRRDEILSQLEGLPEAQRNTILYGDWYVGELAVFTFDYKRDVATPDGYHLLWPHIVSVDPAASGLMGFTLWAAPHENAYRWYCVRAEYIKGGAPSDLVELVERKVKGHNVLYRIMDSHESWFQKQASKLGVKYRGVPNKHGRKKDLIAGLNQAMASERLKFFEYSCGDLISELSTAQWSETAEDKIINASSYHLADSAQYFADMMPKHKDIETQTYSFDHQLHLANRQRQINEEKAAKGEKAKFRIVARRGKTWKR